MDAASFLGLGRVFTANMTGNVVLLGFGVGGAEGLPVLAPLVSLGAFLCGAVVAGRLEGGLVRALAVETALLAVAAAIAALADPRGGTVAAGVVIAFVASALGARTAMVRRLGVPDLTTTVVTLTMTGLASDSPLAGRSGAGTARRIVVVATMLLGAVVGAVLERADVALPLALSAAIGLATVALYADPFRRGSSAVR